MITYQKPNSKRLTMWRQRHAGMTGRVHRLTGSIWFFADRDIVQADSCEVGPTAGLLRKAKNGRSTGSCCQWKRRSRRSMNGSEGHTCLFAARRHLLRN